MGYEVVISDNKTVDPETRREVLESVGAEITMLSERTVENVADAADGADALIVDAATPVTEGVFEASDTLQVVGRAGIGVDNVDIDAARHRGIEVVYVPDYCIDEVSTHALALLLSTVRQLPTFDRQTSDGGWDWTAGQSIYRLRGRTLGLVGFGTLGRRLASKLDGFGLEILAADPQVSAAEMEHFGVERVEFQELLQRSAYVSIHLPLHEQTRNLFDAEAFELMREDAILVNTARGPVIDENGLLAALEAGEIEAAALDVMAEEPPEDSPLPGRDDVLVTPHVAWYSEESRQDLSESVAADVARVLEGEQARAPVPDEPWF